ncbi:MAG: Fic family protein, partial [Gammaproteobacteria bacterium]|nr:Fic family protein [Gammaproteobacteria bacterium]
AIAHFWLITIHPFEDGNGRITRALSDMVLARSDSQSILLYSISSTLLQQRKSYYEVLEQHQRGGVDITLWIQWFLDRLEEAVEQALDKVDRTLFNSRYWQQHRQTALNREQIKVLNRLLEGGERGFEQGISASQYQKVAKVSKATATRHLKELLEKGCVEKLSGGGRSTRYQIRSRMQER